MLMPGQNVVEWTRIKKESAGNGKTHKYKSPVDSSRPTPSRLGSKGSGLFWTLECLPAALAWTTRGTPTARTLSWSWVDEG